MFGNLVKDIGVIIKLVKNKDMVYIILLQMIGIKGCGKMVDNMEMGPSLLMGKNHIMEDGYKGIQI